MPPSALAAFLWGSYGAGATLKWHCCEQAAGIRADEVIRVTALSTNLLMGLFSACGLLHVLGCFYCEHKYLGALSAFFCWNHNGTLRRYL